MHSRSLLPWPQALRCVAMAAVLAAGAMASHAAEAPVAPPPGTPWPVTKLPTPSAQNNHSAAVDALRQAGPLSLAQLTDYALRHNPATQAAWLAAQADGLGVDVARALWWPTLSINAPLTFTRTKTETGASSNNTNPDGTPLEDGREPINNNGVNRAFSPTLSLSWVLFDFGGRAAEVDAARWQAVASQLGYNRSLQTVVNTVELAYFTLLGNRQLQSALQLGVESASASLDVAQARRQAGLATIGEAAQAEAVLADARLQLARAQTQTASAEGGLAAAIGVPVTTPLNVADVPDNTTPESQAFAPGQVDALLASARLSRADLVALDAQVQQAQAQVISTRAQGLPSVALSAQIARTYNSVTANRSTQQLGLALRIPLFDGGLVRAQTQQAQARADVLTAQREQQRQAVELDVWQSYQEANSAEPVIASAQAALKSASVAQNAARERYGAGVGSLLELLLAQTTTAQARVNLVQARYDAYLALSRLGFAVGAGQGMANGVSRNSTGSGR